RPRGELVVDAHVLQRLLDLPARVPLDLDPLVAATVKFDRHRLRTIRLVRAVFDVRPVDWAETLAVLQSVSLADVHSDARARVVDVDGTRVTLDFPALDG